MTQDYPKRRMFIMDSGKHYKIFDFTQDKKEGSIYISSPNFTKIKWLAISADSNSKLTLSTEDSPGDGKLSIHSSGRAGFRAHNAPHDHKLVINGNYLLDLEKGKAGIRHLFTVFMAEPKELPISPAFNRKSDYSLDNSGRPGPFVMIFFAIPRISILTVSFHFSFDIDDLDNIPPEGGLGFMDLAFHSVCWFAYKTKHMNKWPKYPHICYYDGFKVPMFIGTSEGMCRMELHNPIYVLTQTELSITL
jgi:hypothetical protein